MSTKVKMKVCLCWKQLHASI